MFIVDEIRAELGSDPRIHHPNEIAVSERAGAVVLRGTVRSLHQRLAVADIARSTPGVVEVEDQLKIDPRDRWDDDVIRGSALQELMSRDDVPAYRVDVRVRDGWLTLKGEVKRQSESSAAFAAVSGVTGVRGITNGIRVITAGLDG